MRMLIADLTYYQIVAGIYPGFGLNTERREKNTMRKLIIVSIIALLFICFSPFTCAAVNNKQKNIDTEKVFILPTSLKEIEDEAFEGTAVKTAIFPEGLLYIRENAFGNASFLTDVYIPQSTTHIGEHAFPLHVNLVIHGVLGSYAEEWAKKANVIFIPTNMWSVLYTKEDNTGVQIISHEQININVHSEKAKKLHPREIGEGKSMRPQERPEINPIDYDFP